jgi:hypothetical protein
MKRLMTTTALILALGSAAFADGHTAAFSGSQFDTTINLKASDIIGARVYATDKDIDASVAMTADDTVEWDDIGEINEIVLTRDGSVQSVIVGVGGFLGLGEKDVAIDMSQLKIVSDGAAADEYFLVINANAAGIADAPTYGVAADETNQSSDAMANTAPMLARPAVEREGYADVAVGDLTAEDLTGARVYGASDEDVGEIGALILTEDGKLERAVIDVGGFLGLGEKPVAVTFDELQIIRGSDGAVRVYIDSTQEALEALPTHDS